MHKIHFTSLLCFTFIAAFQLGGCATLAVKVDKGETIVSETARLQESELLDVGILLFEKHEITEQQKVEQGAHADVLAAEARYMAYHLKETMQRVNGWGAIRVLPEKSYVTDVIVHGAIMASNGEQLVLHIWVDDSTGQSWFAKTYKTRADDESYQSAKPGRDVYQNVYNRIANDIYRYRKQLTRQQAITIRNISELLYAANISPQPFSHYVTSSRFNKRHAIVRLPAHDDPMLKRVRKVREREFLLIDTINEHYANFYQRMQSPYENWRRYYLIEAEQRRAVERRANTTKLFATAVMIAGVFSDPGTVFAGAMIYKSGMDISKEAEIHNDAIRELSDSLRAEVSPMIVEIQGRTVELTGSIEEQYQKWRRLLREIYINETGFTSGVRL